MTQRKEAFLVSLWFDSGDPGDPRTVRWRGSVVHVSSQQRRYFAEIVDLVAFLATYTSRGAPELTGLLAADPLEP